MSKKKTEKIKVCEFFSGAVWCIEVYQLPIFKTRKEARIYAKKLREALKGIK